MVKECLMIPTHCSCTKARKMMSCPRLLLMFKGNNAMSARSKIAR